MSTWARVFRGRIWHRLVEPTPDVDGRMRSVCGYSWPNDQLAAVVADDRVATRCMFCSELLGGGSSKSSAPPQ